MDERKLRERAVVIRRGRVLLVKDKTLNRFSQPGGGLQEEETLSHAAARELQEETNLVASKLHCIGSFRGTVSHHKAFLVEVTGRVRLKSKDQKGGG